MEHDVYGNAVDTCCAAGEDFDLLAGIVRRLENLDSKKILRTSKFIRDEIAETATCPVCGKSITRRVLVNYSRCSECRRKEWEALVNLAQVGK